ncbi:MAG: hypothetical protein OEM28_09955 [Nitrosopumilus sp.]|nr:hypothetical protein [Nitrosopumilus sp.]MDH3488283.1 hypothetical protein [Nitrosopumilus sp.]
MHANALPGNAELVLEDIQIEPPYPKKGELVKITGDVYNAGLVDTDSLASIITAAFFVDEKLFHINEIGNIKPGIKNKIKISSDLIWNAEPGSHKIKIILDYHDTLNDKYDSPTDNIKEKTLFIELLKSAKFLFDISPQYFIQGTRTPKVTISLLDSDSNETLSNKKIILNFNDSISTLTTNKEGIISFSSSINSLGTSTIGAYFGGDLQYSSANASSTIYSLPKEITSIMIMQILDMKNQYDFEENIFDIVIFQDSYDNLIKKIQPTSANLLDSKTFWVSLPPEHDYFAEIYMNGRLFFVTDKELLKENTVVKKELKIPETAKIKFRIIDEENQPFIGVLVQNWIYSSPTTNGFTDWMDVLPTTFGDPYVADVILSDQRIIKSAPFLVFSGEHKIIDIVIAETHYMIPSWIKNNAGWWADGSIDDSSFLHGIQYLINEGILIIPPTAQGSNSNSDEIPEWIKNNAGWWADGSIDDSSFLHGIQYLIEQGIMKIL